MCFPVCIDIQHHGVHGVLFQVIWPKGTSTWFIGQKSINVELNSVLFN